MIPWVQVYSNLPQHDKIVSLADALGLKCSGVSPEAVATGLLVSLWCWAVQNRTDGDLSGVNPRTIAKACQWEKSPDKLVSALRDCGWLDADMHIHDWEEYSVRLMENQEAQKEKTRKRVAEYRERHAKGGKAKAGNADENETATYNKASSNENVTVTRNVTVTDGNAADTQCNASTVPNLTVPNLTVPYHTVQDGEDGNKPDTLVGGVTPADAAKNIETVLGEIREAWNGLGLGSITPIDPMSARGAAVQLRMKRFGRDGVLAAIAHVRESAFLRGDNDPGWRASFDWLMEETHCQRAIEGGYADYKAMPKPEVYRGPTQEDIARMQEYLDFFNGGCGNAQSHCPDGSSRP